MNLSYILLSIGVMSLTTYLIRMLPLVLFRKKITDPFIRNFLFYVPYAVLTAMTIPAIFSATSSPWSALAGLSAAMVVAYKGKTLMPVAMTAVAAAFVVELLMGF